MDMYKLKWTSLQEEVFRFLCIKAGISFSVRGIASNLRKSPTAISNAISILEKEKMIIVDRARKINLLSVELNRDNYKVINLKRIENLKLIYESRIVEYLSEHFPEATIILFGSYSFGEDVCSNSNKYISDVDIAVIGSKEKKIDLSRFNSILEREFSLQFYDNFNSIHKNLKENILNGIILKGGVQL